MHRRPAIVLLSALIIAAASLANGQQAAVSFSSGTQRITLLELYTSEGCSSCPPADAWLSELKSDPRLWQGFIPIALHVDYWDYIGWRDRFATASYSARQKRYAQEGGARFVYTPGFFANGKDWAGWRYGENVKRQVANVGDLTVHVDGDKLAASFAPTDAHGQALIINVALLGMNLETKVKAGENHGRVLRHDFVVLGLANTPLRETADGFAAAVELPGISQQVEELALVAWVSSAETQTPLQAVGGYLP